MSSQQRVDSRGSGARSEPTAAVPVGGPSRPGAERLPRPPGRRRPGLALLAVLLIVLGGAVAGLLALRIDDRIPVLVARHQIAVGQQITRDDLAVARIAAEGVQVIPAGQAGSVIGRYATTPIAGGRLLDDGMLGDSGLLKTGLAAVGIALQPGRYPASGLESGDVVQVVRAVEGAGRPLTSSAIVGSVQAPGDSVFGSASNDTTVVTVVVEQGVAPAIAAAALNDQVSLVLLRRGDPSGAG